MKNSGFTLLELMVTLAIAGVVIAMAIPGFVSWLPGYRLKSAAMDIYSDLQYAKMAAIKSSSNYSVEFETVPGKYRILDGNGAEEKVVMLSDYGSGVKFGHGNATQDATQNGTANFDNEVTLSADTATFNNRGMLTVAAVGYVYLAADDGKSYAVGIFPTGLISIMRWNGTKYQ